MHLRTRRVFTAVAAALALAGAAATAACGTPAPAVVEPASYGPTYGGQLYCGYRFIPAECWGEPGLPVLLPTSTPLASDLLAVALYHHFLTYHSAYDGGWGWDRYERNARRTHVTLVMTRTTYISNGTKWGQAHANEIRPYAAKAAYKSTRGGKTTTVRGDKYATAANKSADLSTAKEAKKTGTAGNAGKPATGGGTTTTGGKTTTRTGTGGGSKYTGGAGSGPKVGGGTVRRK